MKHVISCTKLVNFSGKKKHKNQQQKKKTQKPTTIVEAIIS